MPRSESDPARAPRPSPRPSPKAEGVLVGLISDTHGLMRPEALAALEGCSHIVHAGDIGGQAIVAALEALAPVTAVRGNNDTDAWGQRLPAVARLEIQGVRILAIHDIAELDMADARRRAEVVVCGHSHKPRADEVEGLLVVNPGSAGPRRFTLPICVARLHLGAGTPRVEMLPLVLATPPSRTPDRTRATRRGSGPPPSRPPRR